MPADLCVDLPLGEKQLPPLLSTIQPEFPAWFVGDDSGGIAAGAMVPRIAEASIFNMIAAMRLHGRLRAKQAVSYTPCVFYEPLNADTGHMVLFADSDKNRRAELTDAFGEVFEGLTEIDYAEVDTARKLYVDGPTGPLAPSLSERTVLKAQRAAVDWLLRREYESLEALAEEAALASAARVAGFTSKMQRTTLFAVPGNAAIRPWMGKRVPVSSGPAVEGREVRAMDAPIQPERLVHGPAGVSIKRPHGSHITIQYADLAGTLYYEDGCICLISSNATSINIEPTLWQNGPSVCREILGRVSARLIVKQTRSADQILKPTTTAWQRFRASLS